MKTKHVFRTLAVLAALVVAALFSPSVAHAANVNTFTFTDEGIVANAPADAYSIKNAADLSIAADGTYTITGTCSEGSIAVKKNLEVTLILDNLDLASSTTAPLSVKAEANVTIHLSGTNVLTDNEPDPEDAEGACIKVSKASSSETALTKVTFCGDGDLTCVANTKNGIKGGAQTALVFNQTGTITVKGNVDGYASKEAAANNGIAADGSVTINQGIFNIYVANDGIKSDPDVGDINEGTSTDTVSEGKVTINGGEITIYADGDGIHADSALIVNGGIVMVKTMEGYKTSGTKYVTNNKTGSQYTFDPDTMSAKAFKAGGDRAEELGTVPSILIKGGIVAANSADDAIHSDGTVTITAGIVEIYSGDDGIHAETDLVSGVKGSTIVRDPDVTITYSYEGLEGATVTINSGRYYIAAKDDGINAAGGSSNGPGGSGWTPWGGGAPGADRDKYNITINGGNVFVVCNGDGLDSNGNLYLYGGTIIVCSMPNGDNSALDADGTRAIDGATVFTAGAKGVDGTVKASWFPNGQKYVAVAGSYSKGQGINVSVNGTVVFNGALPQGASYVMFTAPGLSANPTIAKGSFSACSGGSFTHSWDEGVVTVEPTEDAPGLKTYTCTECGATETQSLAQLPHIDDCDHGTASSGFVATLEGEGVSFNVYYSKNSVEPDEVGAYYAIARDGDTGEIDESGNGQVNFTVVPADGYSVVSVSATAGTYKNIKDISADTGIPNTYRVTKVTADTTITVETALCSHDSVTADDIAWAWDKGTATASFHCDDCGGDFTVAADVTSVLTGADVVTFTASVKVGEKTFQSTATAAPYTATFAGDKGVDSVSVFYIQKNTTPDEVGAATAVARDSKTGMPVISGDGQINFLVTLKDGYEIVGVSATEGSYKNIKGPEDTGTENLYRITKVTGDMTIAIATKHVAGWANENGGWYCYDEDGALLKNTFVPLNGKYYYVGKDGKLVTGGWIEYGNKAYYIDSDWSLALNRWVGYKGAYYYFDENAQLVVNAWKQIDGKSYYFDENAKLAINTFIQHDGKWYYFDENAQLVTNTWFNNGNDWYYIKPNGQICIDEWYDYQGHACHFNKNGICDYAA